MEGFLMSFVEKIKPGVLFSGALAIVFLLSACGKQRPRETPVQRGERILNTIDQKYREELALVSAEKDEKKVKKQLGKIVENRRVTRHASDTFNRIFLGKSFDPERTPFHRYISVITDDIAWLKKNETLLATSGCTELLEKSKDLRCMLLEIKQYILKHKEYKAEGHFRSLRNEMLAQRRY